MKFMSGILFVLLSQSVYASDSKDALSCYAELTGRKDYFSTQSQHSAHCSSSSCEQCLLGVNKLIDLIPEGAFPNPNFDAIFIKEAFDDVDTHGFVDINFQASTADILVHLRNQTDEYKTIKELQDQFSSSTEHGGHCNVDTKSKCIEGLNKLIELSENASDLFPNPNFDAIFIKEAFDEVDEHGFVDINYAATVKEIEAHLRRQ